jgi:hypothetical protein
VDEALCAYQEAWDAFVDSWLVVRIQDPQVSQGLVNYCLPIGPILVGPGQGSATHKGPAYAPE